MDNRVAEVLYFTFSRSVLDTIIRVRSNILSDITFCNEFIIASLCSVENPSFSKRSTNLNVSKYTCFMGILVWNDDNDLLAHLERVLSIEWILEWNDDGDLLAHLGLVLYIECIIDR